MDATTIIAWSQVAAAAATAFATVGLVFYTWRLAERSSQPHVVATIEVNTWSLIHLDVVVANTGNATAYDIRVKFDPPLLTESKKEKTPLRTVSVLKPGQQVASFIGEHQELSGRSFQVEVTWRRSHHTKRVETNSYTFDMSQYEAMTILGAASPAVQIADQLKKLREDWRYVASGSKKIRVDSFSSEDRAEERRILDERYGRGRPPKGDPPPERDAPDEDGPPDS